MRNGLQDSSFSYQTVDNVINRRNNGAQIGPLPYANHINMPKISYSRQYQNPWPCGLPPASGPVLSEKYQVIYERKSAPDGTKRLSQQKIDCPNCESFYAKPNRPKKFGYSCSYSRPKKFGYGCYKKDSNCSAASQLLPSVRELYRKRSDRKLLNRPTKQVVKKNFEEAVREQQRCRACNRDVDIIEKNPSASGALPFEQHYEQPLPPTPNYASYPQATATAAAASYAPPQMAAQYAPPHLDYRTAGGGQQSALSQTPATGMPSYADQLQQMTESYQQEQLLAQQQQQQQEQLLMDLYKTTPQGQGRAVTDSPGRSQAFYTADQYINFLNRQHQDVFSQQQNQPAGYQFSPMSAYTPGMPSTMNGGSQGMGQYSPSANVSRVNYTNGKLSYNY